jgi:hypothetical protein
MFLLISTRCQGDQECRSLPQCNSHCTMTVHKSTAETFGHRLSPPSIVSVTLYPPFSLQSIPEFNFLNGPILENLTPSRISSQS